MLFGKARQCMKIPHCPGPDLREDLKHFNSKTNILLSLLCWLVVSNIFYFHPYLGKIPILTIIFFKGVETTN